MTDTPEPHDETHGILYAGGAYVVWGFVPLYWRLLDGVSPVEITLHRILWCSLFGLAVTARAPAASRISSLVLRTPRLLGALMASSLLITANWTIYIYCVSTHQLGRGQPRLLPDAAGLHRARRRAAGREDLAHRIAAIALATVAVAVQAISLGHIPWIAPALALTFGFYGYVRKLTPVDSLDGLTIETVPAVADHAGR